MNISNETLQKIQLLLKLDQKLQAVVIVREETKCSLKEAKDYVDQLGEIAITPITVENIDQQLRILLSQGRKLEAVKLYKEHSGEGLAASKDYVDHLAAYGVAPAADTKTAIDRILQEQANSQPSSPLLKWVILYIMITLAIGIINWLFFR